MKRLPSSENVPVVRTHFVDDRGWQSICDAIRRPSDEGFLANVEFVSDPELSDVAIERVLARLPEDYDHSFLIIADRTTFSSSEHPLLVVDLQSQRGRTFRALPSVIHSVENNLSLANMDFEDFVGSVGSDGIFRGFPRR